MSAGTTFKQNCSVCMELLTILNSFKIYQYCIDNQLQSYTTGLLKLKQTKLSWEKLLKNTAREAREKKRIFGCFKKKVCWIWTLMGSINFNSPVGNISLQNIIEVYWQFEEGSMWNNVIYLAKITLVGCPSLATIIFWFLETILRISASNIIWCSR